MNDTSAPAADSRLATLTGWGLAAAYAVHQTITITLARTDRGVPAREDLRGWHYMLGTLLLVLVIARLWAWARDRRPAPPPGLGAGAFHWGRTLALGSYLLILAAPLLGVLYGWAEGHVIHFGPLFDLPTLMGKNRLTWMFTGYFHSAMGFMLLLLNLAALLTAAYTLFRYGRGLFAALPPGYGAQVLAGMTLTVYAFSTFRSPEPGPRNVAIFLALLAVAWGIAHLIHRRRAATPREARTPGFARVAAPLAVFALVGAGAYAPYAQFRVTPWPIGEAIEAPEGVTSHAAPVIQVALPPETDFERQVKAETYKWCRFCHTVEKGGEHKVGPNLYAIFGQRAGTVPNFHYSDAIVGARNRGLVWTDETIAAYIADPQKYLPGTTMIVSSGPIPDPKVQQAIVNILKRETMQDAAR